MRRNGITREGAKLAKGDKWMIAGIVLAALLIICGRYFIAPGSGALAAEVAGPWGDPLILPMDDAATASESRWELDGPAGGLTLVYDPNKGFCVESASCPDLLCVRSGYIRRVGQSIVCVPNRIVIRLTSAGTGTGEAGEGGEALDAILR